MRKLPILLAAAASLAVTASCTSDTTQDAIELGPPSVHLARVNGATPAPGACVAVLSTGAVSVGVAIVNWELRPPELCAIRECGQLVGYVDGKLVATLGAPDIELPVSAATGAHTLKVEVWQDGATEVATDYDGKPLADSITVDLEPGCVAADAGTDASADAGEDASTDASVEADATDDASADASVEADASDDASDAGTDAASETGTDGGGDAGVDAPTEADTDAAADAGAPTDAGADAPAEADTDAAGDAGADAATDAPAD